MLPLADKRLRITPAMFGAGFCRPSPHGERILRRDEQTCKKSDEVGHWEVPEPSLTVGLLPRKRAFSMILAVLLRKMETFALGMATFTVGMNTFVIGVEAFATGMESFTAGIESSRGGAAMLQSEMHELRAGMRRL